MSNPLYFVETVSPRVRGAWFVELDRDTNSRAHVIGLIRTGEVRPIKILEVDESAGTCRDVTLELTEEADDMAIDEFERVESLGLADRFDRARDLRKHEAV